MGVLISAELQMLQQALSLLCLKGSISIALAGRACFGLCFLGKKKKKSMHLKEVPAFSTSISVKRHLRNVQITAAE